MRRRGKSCNDQVRIAGWRSFTKSFKSKSDAVCWVQQKEHLLKNTSPPEVDVGDATLRELLQTYAKEVSSHLKGSEIETYKLNLYSKHPFAENKLVNLTQRHFEHLRDERLKQVKPGTVQADLMMFRGVFKTAMHKWGYGLTKNPVQYLQLP